MCNSPFFIDSRTQTQSAQRINGQAKIQVCKRKDMRKFLVLDCVCVCNGEVTAIYRSRLGDDLETKKT